MITTSFFDIPFTHFTSEEIIQRIVKNSSVRKMKNTPESRVYHFLNAFCITEFHESNEIKKCYQDYKSVNLCDGISIAISHKLFVNTSIKRIRGGDFLRTFFKSASNSTIRIGILGGNNNSMQEIISSINSRFSNLKIVFAYEPPFTEISKYPIKEITKKLEAAELDVCLVAIGTPKQDVLARILSEQVDIDFFCIGAALEFLIGSKKEAPKMLQNLGMEWLYRLITEPRRLGRRYLIGIPKYLKVVLHFYLIKGRDFMRENQ
jgi:N-acetylglucosaminyldiphosphoundecaprenol N-acetyl-beta-D-mannosaminyltransferase